MKDGNKKLRSKTTPKNIKKDSNKFKNENNNKEKLQNKKIKKDSLNIKIVKNRNDLTKYQCDIDKEYAINETKDFIIINELKDSPKKDQIVKYIKKNS